jgi:hypothetical protein
MGIVDFFKWFFNDDYQKYHLKGLRDGEWYDLGVDLLTPSELRNIQKNWEKLSIKTLPLTKEDKEVIEREKKRRKK